MRPYPTTPPRAYVRAVALTVLLSVASACGSTRTVATAPTAAPSQTGLRVYSSAARRTVPFADLVADAARADMVFFGEQHDDPETHFAEFALLEAIGRVRPRVVLSLEMFERDVQPMLDDYLAGRMREADFLAASRPWDRYATDYRGLVMLARARGWPVVASNVPRPIASAVSRMGLGALDTLAPRSRAFAARKLACPHDTYYDRFVDEMKGHSPSGTPPPSAPQPAAPSLSPAMADRFYEAQCVKDETMAESLTEALARAGPGAIVVHFDGAFHSDFGLGTAERARRRAPNARSVIVTAAPVPDPASADATPFAARGDYVIFTKKPPAK